MLRKVVSYTGSLAALLMAGALFVFSEGLLIYSVNEVGVVYTVIIFFIISAPICLGIHWIYESKVKKQSWLNRLDEWVRKKEKTINPKWVLFAGRSKPIAVLLFSATSGVFSTSIFVELLGFRNRIAIFLILLNVAFFYILWSLIYSGALNIVGKVIPFHL